MVLFKRKFVIVCHEKVVRIPLEGDEILQVHGERTQGVVKTLMNTKVEFRIDLVHGAISVAKSPYRLAPLEMQELSEQLRELQGKDNSKEWNSGEDQLKLRWTIYLMVLADAAESVSDTIGFEYCLASSSGWTKSSNCGDETSQKDYADSSRKPLEFEVGNRELLKVTPWKGVVRKISGHEVKSGLNVENGGSYGPFGLKEEVLGFQAKWLNLGMRFPKRGDTVTTMTWAGPNFLVCKQIRIGTVLKFDFLRSTCACKWLLEIMRRWAQFSPLLLANPAVIARVRVLGSAAAAFQSSLHHEDHEQEVLVPQQLSFYHVFP
ncbi:hypothetical protein Tco_0965847 [Tanacetum coccineum]